MRLLVAIDGTDASDDALDYALDIAVRIDAAVVVTYIIESAAHVTESEQSSPREGDDEENGEFVQKALEDARLTGERLLRDAVNRAHTNGVDIDTQLATGDPLETLPSLVEVHSADAIVVGHRSADDDPHEVVESVARGLIECSPVPVTVVT